MALMLCSTGAWAATINLASVSTDITAQNNDVLTGTLGSNVKVSIADNATVTLNRVTINGTHNSSYLWAGITLLGNATIVLEGTNTVKGFNQSYSGIFVPEGCTLTIQGTGSLTASNNGWAAGIGGCYGTACGNIVIEGGTIKATGGYNGAGIGSCNASCGDITISGGTVTATGGESCAGIGSGTGNGASCGDITITGGTVTATGGDSAAGIGSGQSDVTVNSCGDITITGGTVTAKGTYGPGIGSAVGSTTLKTSCGKITIKNSVNSVTANGFFAASSIGAGSKGECGTITIGGKVVSSITASSFTYPVSMTAQAADGAYWATYYNSTYSYQADVNTTVLMVKLDGSSLTTTAVADRIIPIEQGVVLKSTDATVKLYFATSVSGADYTTNNSLTGTNSNISNPGNAYVLNYTAENGVGFYKLKASGTIGANKAYLNGGGSAREFFSLNDDATSIGATLNDNAEMTNENVVYDLAGRRVENPVKGIYIVNGKKVIF